MYRNNYLINNKALEKLKKGELKIEDILMEDELVMDVKTNPSSQFSSIFNSDNIKTLIDYITKVPESDDHNSGYKFPFNACEILQSENSFILEKIFESIEHTEVEEESKRKTSNESSENYKDDHSIEESEESGEEDHARHDAHDIYTDDNARESEVESKTMNGVEVLLDDHDGVTPAHVHIDKENMDEDVKEGHDEDWQDNVAHNAEDDVVVQHDSEDNYELNQNDEDALNEIGKKIQNLEFQVSYEQLEHDNNNFQLDQNAYGSVENNLEVIVQEEANVEVQEVNDCITRISEETEKLVDNERFECQKNKEEIVQEVTNSQSDKDTEENTEENREIESKLENDDSNKNENEDNSTENQVVNQHEINGEVLHAEQEQNTNTIIERDDWEVYIADNEATQSNHIDQDDNNDDADHKDIHEEEEKSHNTEEQEVENKQTKLEDESSYYRQDNNEHTEDSETNNNCSTSIEEKNSEHVKEQADEHEQEQEISHQEVETDNSNTNARHRSIPRHKKHHSQRHEFVAEEEEDIFNISNDNLQNSNYNTETPVKEIKIKFELIDYLFDFLKSKGDLNYVLAGYFAKIFNHMMTHKNITLLKYIFTQRMEVIDDLILNSNRKSISECLLKILHSPTEEIKCGLQIKLEIIDKIISFLADDADEERVENLVSLLIELIGNKHFSMVFLKNLTLFKKIHCITIFIMREDSNASSHILKELFNILTRVNENILKDFGTSAVTPQAQKEPDFMTYSSIDNFDEMLEVQNSGQAETFDLKSNLDTIVEIITESGTLIVKDFLNIDENSTQEIKEFSSTYNRTQKVLGLKKMAEFDYLKTTFEILLNVYALDSYASHDKIENFFELLIVFQFFEVCLQNFYQFEFNNFYQKSFEHLVILACNKHTPGRLIHHLFAKKEENSGEEELEIDFIYCDFLKIILDKVENNLDFIFDSGRRINSGHFAISLEMCEYISKTENKILLQILKKNTLFHRFCLTVVNPVLNRFDQGLLFDLNSKGVCLEKLNCLNENESSERISKEQETPQYNPPLDQILKDSFSTFHNLEDTCETKQNEDADVEVDIYAKINPIDLNTNSNAFDHEDNYSSHNIEKDEEEVVKVEEDANSPNFGILDYGHFHNENAGNLDNIQSNNISEDKNLFEAKVFKMNERYFSNNEEDEIKDCDLILDDVDINLEIPAENVANVHDSATPLIVSESNNVETSSTFFDNNFWKNYHISEEEIMKELNII